MESADVCIANCEEVLQTGADAHGGRRGLLIPGRVGFGPQGAVGATPGRGRAGFGPEGAVGATSILALFSDMEGAQWNNLV